MNRIVSKSKKIIQSVLSDCSLSETNEQPNLLNQAINFEKQVIFIAIPKTGTTSVRSQLTQKGKYLIPNPHLNITQVRDSLYTYLLKETLGKNRSFPTEGLPSDEELRRSSNEMFTSFFKFAGVRNPWVRAVSLFMRREGIRLEKAMSFEEFCEQHIYASDTCHHPTLHHNQLDWLCDESGQCLMDYIYKLEEFDDAVDDIEKRTQGRIVLKKLKRNVNPNSMSVRYRELYTDRTRRLIAERFAKDIEYFNYTF